MIVEAVILTGGRSSRMGRDKASIAIDGVPMAERIANGIRDLGIQVTVLGPHRLAGSVLVEDSEPFAGPLAALAGFVPRSAAVLVSSCDLPSFDPRIVGTLVNRLPDKDAAVPVVEGFPQPLCAVYRADAFEVARTLMAEGARSMMAWLDRLNWAPVTEAELEAAGIDPGAAQGVNTERQLSDAIARTQ
jgi:molybdenum cofactor guanylyltransferase